MPLWSFCSPPLRLGASASLSLSRSLLVQGKADFKVDRLCGFRGGEEQAGIILIISVCARARANPAPNPAGSAGFSRIIVQANHNCSLDFFFFFSSCQQKHTLTLTLSLGPPLCWNPEANNCSLRGARSSSQANGFPSYKRVRPSYKSSLEPIITQLSHYNFCKTRPSTIDGRVAPAA